MTVYVQGSSVEIQTQTQRNPLGRSMTRPAACVIAQQYSSATNVSLRYHSCKEKFGGRFENIISFPPPRFLTVA